MCQEWGQGNVEKKKAARYWSYELIDVRSICKTHLHTCAHCCPAGIQVYRCIWSCRLRWYTVHWGTCSWSDTRPGLEIQGEHLSDDEMQFKSTLHWRNHNLAHLICFLLHCCHLTSTAHWQELGAFKDTYTLRNWYFAAKPLLGRLSENVGRTCSFRAENSFILDLWAWTENQYSWSKCDGQRTLLLL